MKYIIGAFLCISFLSECTTSTTKTTTTDSTTTPSAIPTAVRGLYKGDFAGSPIYITINYSSDNHVAGYNTHKGLRRNISGLVKQTADGWELDVNEPGDHPFDGKFKLLFNSDFSTAKGTWGPLNTPSTLTEKAFTITRIPARQEGKENYDDVVFQETLTSDHADITFGKDGTCLFNYYEKITDSTFAQQMNTIRGTWEKKDSSIVVNWQKNDRWNKSNSTFKIVTDTDSGYGIAVEGEDIHFYPAM